MYKVLPEKHHNFNIIELSEGPYAGCQLVYGELKFGDELENGSVNLSFDYEITNNFTVEKKEFGEFQNYLGEVLLKIIEDSLEESNTVFHGGTNEGSVEVPLDEK